MTFAGGELRRWHKKSERRAFLNVCNRSQRACSCRSDSVRVGITVSVSVIVVVIMMMIIIMVVVKVVLGVDDPQHSILFLGLKF